MVNVVKEKVVGIGESDMVFIGMGEMILKFLDEVDFYFYSVLLYLYFLLLDIWILKIKFGLFLFFLFILFLCVEYILIGYVVDDVMRKCVWYFGYFLRGCVISYLECDWIDIILVEILEVFSKDIEKRWKYNCDKVV